MTNQQLLDYIKQQLQQGVNREQIKSSLMTNGWQEQDIEEGFNSVNTPVLPGQSPTTPINPSIKKWKVFAGILIGAIVVGGGVYFASQTLFKPDETPKISNEVSGQLPTNKPTETVAPSEQPSQSQNPEIVFADKLSSCTKYKTTFKHPFTGETLEKEILGIVNGKCNYVEQMPNSGKMECNYLENERIAVAQYYKDVATAKSVGTSVDADLGSGKQKTTYTINGKVVDNPLQEATNSGICVISGY